MMGFACDCDEPADVCNVTFQKARKSHKCCECGHEITSGQEYKRVKMLFDGFWSDDCICERCDDLQAAFQDLGYCYCVGEFFEAYSEWLDEQHPNGGEMATAIRQKHKGWRPPSEIQEQRESDG